MSLRAKCLLGIQGAGARAAKNVLVMSHRFEMRGIDTARIPTKVIEFAILRNRPYQMLVTVSVGISSPAIPL